MNRILPLLTLTLITCCASDDVTRDENTSPTLRVAIARLDTNLEQVRVERKQRVICEQTTTIDGVHQVTCQHAPAAHATSASGFQLPFPLRSNQNNSKSIQNGERRPVNDNGEQRNADNNSTTSNDEVAFSLTFPQMIDKLRRVRNRARKPEQTQIESGSDSKVATRTQDAQHAYTDQSYRPYTPGVLERPEKRAETNQIKVEGEKGIDNELQSARKDLLRNS